MKSATPKVLHPIGGRTLVGPRDPRRPAARGPSTSPSSCATSATASRRTSREVDPDAVIADQDEVKGTGRAVECALDGPARRA